MVVLLTLGGLWLVEGAALHRVSLAEHVVGHYLLETALSGAIGFRHLVLGRVDHGVFAELALLVQEVRRLVLRALHFLSNLLQTGQGRMVLSGVYTASPIQRS